MDKYLIGTIAQVLGSCTLMYAYFPQIIRLLKTKDATGVSPKFWSKLTLGLSCVAINLTISKVNIFIQCTQWFNVFLAFTVLMLAIKYKPTSEESKNKEIELEA
ncbi:PQ-loop domain-containing transporter [Clostridium massiliamazoniense]|uniref:PQ-loop domain-containing transporter n=1 Tax=Clostridium massiliamazoniense TaxID=1347366 RepID=UPI000AD34D79|nr:PQ-loop domain-containing transporter [Clostridium massiliamazoniense]